MLYRLTPTLIEKGYVYVAESPLFEITYRPKGKNAQEETYFAFNEKDPICKFCDMCINEGIYVIVDWNVGYDKKADENKEAAVDFFTRLSLIYADVPNVIYEVSNEDLTVDEENPVKDEWEKAIAPFASDVIKAIRENSPDSIVIVGTALSVYSNTFVVIYKLTF